MNRRSIVFAVLLIVVLVLPVAAQSGPGVGEVQFLDGQVRINGQEAFFGQAVSLGDWVETGPDSAVDIVFDGANVFRLGENTVAVLNLGESRQQVDLRFGTFSAVFDRVRTLSGRGTFDVQGPTTVAGVRGTSFFIRVVDSATTYVCTCNGTLELSPSAGNPFIESAAEHSAYFFRAAEGGAVNVETAGELYHSNDSLNTIAESIGVEIPWGDLPEGE
jgi:hypothetical protein